MSNETALVKAKGPVSDISLSVDKFIDASMKSGLFKDTKDAAQACVKISLGASLGLDPVTSMASIYLVQGKPSLSTNLMVARVLQRADRYRYEILETTATKCSIQFWHRIEDFTDDGKPVKRWVKPGPPEIYTIEEAKAAGLTKNPVWTSFPKNMVFNRCFSNGMKKYCADLMNGVPIYTPDELDPNMKLTVTADGEVIPDAEYTPAPAPKKAVPVTVKDTGNWSDSVQDIKALEIRTLMADTKTDEAHFLTTLLQKSSVADLTGPERDKVVAILTQKKQSQPGPTKQPF